MSNPSTLSTLRRLHEAATRGPWKACTNIDGGRYFPHVHMGEHETFLDGECAHYVTINTGERVSVCDTDAALVAAMRNALPALLAVCEAADKLRQASEAKRQRARDLQELAAKARAGGPSGRAVLDEYDRTHPVVWDISDAVDEICSALAGLEGEGP